MLKSVLLENPILPVSFGAFGYLLRFLYYSYLTNAPFQCLCSFAVLKVFVIHGKKITKFVHFSWAVRYKDGDEKLLFHQRRIYV